MEEEKGAGEGDEQRVLKGAEEEEEEQEEEA